jgi:hypothetical protein
MSRGNPKKKVLDIGSVAGYSTDMTQSHEYLEGTPTKVRIFQEGDHWAMDGSDGTDYTEVVWDSFDGEYISSTDQALSLVSSFCREQGWPELPAEILDNDGQKW